MRKRGMFILVLIIFAGLATIAFLLYRQNSMPPAQALAGQACKDCNILSFTPLGRLTEVGESPSAADLQLIQLALPGESRSCSIGLWCVKLDVASARKLGLRLTYESAVATVEGYDKPQIRQDGRFISSSSLLYVNRFKLLKTEGDTRYIAFSTSGTTSPDFKEGCEDICINNYVIAVGSCREQACVLDKVLYGAYKDLSDATDISLHRLEHDAQTYLAFVSARIMDKPADLAVYGQLFRIGHSDIQALIREKLFCRSDYLGIQSSMNYIDAIEVKAVEHKARVQELTLKCPAQVL